jgi:SAM-dependent methyltransferase
MGDEHPELEALRRRLEEEERTYASLLAAVDRLAQLPQPTRALPELSAQRERLNAAWDVPRAPEGGGLAGRARRRQWQMLAPVLDRQREFNSTTVQLLNGYLDETARLHARLAELASALVQYCQRILPVVDARDRIASALATTRAELVLEAFDRRQESLARRLEGLLALRDRLETVSAEVSGIRAALAGVTEAAPLPSRDDAAYVAFENVYRGDPEALRQRLAGYVALFDAGGPVVDLGCGRGEFLELLRAAGIAGRGVESNAEAVALCRSQGLDVTSGDLVAFLRQQPDGTLGGVFAAQVVEHLPPGVLTAAIREAHRALKAGGVLVLETVNVRSVHAFHEVYLRDLTHITPLHPDTLRFVAAAQGFTDVRVEMRTPVDAAGRLQPIPVEGLPAPSAAVLNENVARLNAILYGPQEYALIARR